MNIFDNVNTICVAQEGATNDAREIISSEDFKTAIQHMKIAILKRKKKDYKEAIKEYEISKKIFIDLRTKAQKIKVYPISVIIGSTVGFIAAARDINDATSNDVLTVKQREKIAKIHFLAALSNFPVHQIYGIPLSKVILNAENKKADKKGPSKIANSAVAAVIDLLNVYISACDEHIEDCKIEYESGVLKVDIL